MVGNSGAGKSTFARALADRLGIPRLELDAFFWDAGWTKRDPDEARRLIRDAVADAPDGWVADGNWTGRVGDSLDGVEAWVWLDFPRRVVIPRVVRRTLCRGISRAELWHGNREDLRSLLSRDPHRNIVMWSWTAHRPTRERYAELARTAPVVRLRTPREATRWLDAV
ncbi:P-loop NTPase family protein [Cellulomonas rhizosphaerae]|uniref:AAA family ATPase n=1 Tax=Cellulomonas rhizosphaerae TaxID=2293719 RepID=UPI001F25E238|nr:AAA family ATPase [Cellulomonas rhizosphaerae]